MLWLSRSISCSCDLRPSRLCRASSIVCSCSTNEPWQQWHAAWFQWYQKHRNTDTHRHTQTHTDTHTHTHRTHLGLCHLIDTGTHGCHQGVNLAGHSLAQGVVLLLQGERLLILRKAKRHCICMSSREGGGGGGGGGGGENDRFAESSRLWSYVHADSNKSHINSVKSKVS